MFYIDWTYIILVMPAVIFSIWASSRVGTTFEKYSKQNSSRRMTGAEAAYLSCALLAWRKNERLRADTARYRKELFGG